MLENFMKKIFVKILSKNIKNSLSYRADTDKKRRFEKNAFKFLK